MAETLSGIPLEFYKKLQPLKPKAVSGALLGAIGLVYVAGEKNLKSRRSFLLMASGAAAGYIAGPLMPSIDNLRK